MSVEALKQAVGFATADGYVGWWEAPAIKRAALLHDNTVNAAERSYLKDTIARGFWADPGVLGVFQELAFFGETSLADQMDHLRKQKQRERWFNDDYRRHAEPLIVMSTDTIDERMGAVAELARETRMFQSEERALGEKVLMHSHDPILDRLQAARRFKREVSLFDSDYKQLALALIKNSYDLPENRRKALDALDRDVHLWRDEKEAVSWFIDRDDQSLD